MFNQYKSIYAYFLLQLMAGTAAAFTTSLGAQSSLLEPAGWNIGDINSTHQFWNAKSSSTGNVPDQGYNVGGGLLDNPVLGVEAPGFRTGTSNFYSLNGQFAVSAEIPNHGGPTSGMGTHVIIQLGTSINDQNQNLLAGSLVLTDPSENVITGGLSANALQNSQVSSQEDIFVFIGIADYEEKIFEFWLPGYTGDIHINWDQAVHASIDTLRVDTMIAAELPGAGSPFPLTTSTPGDFNSDSLVNAADYTVWRDSGGSIPDYNGWASNFGNDYSMSSATAVSIPEPSSTSLVMMFGMTAAFGGWMSWFTRPPR